MKKLFIFIVVVINSFFVFSKQLPATDSSSIRVREIPNNVIQDYKNNPAYDYEKVIPKDKSIFERVMDWVWDAYEVWATYP